MKKIDFKELFLGFVFMIVSYFMLGIFLLESKLTIALIERGENIVNLLAIKTILLAILATTITVYVYYLKKKTQNNQKNP